MVIEDFFLIIIKELGGLFDKVFEFVLDVTGEIGEKVIFGFIELFKFFASVLEFEVCGYAGEEFGCVEGFINIVYGTFFESFKDVFWI